MATVPRFQRLSRRPRQQRASRPGPDATAPSNPAAPVSERELLERLRRGDEGAFDAIFRAHYPGLVTFLDRLLRGRGEAEEVAQEVMLELWRRRDGLDIRESLRAYLYRAARNRALNVLRHERVVEAAAPYARMPESEQARAEPDLLEQELDAAVAAAVAQLPERCREIFQLSRVNGLRYVEIADTLGISVKTVEAQMGRALRLLRERLASWLPNVAPSGS